MSPIAGAERSAYADRSDEWLVEQCRGSRADDAFAELVRRYQRPVFRLAISILGQQFSADAEDVAQDVMVRVHRSLPAFRGDAKFGSWIYRITFNQALNVKQRMRFRAPHVSDEALGAAASGERTADDELQRQRRDQAVADCVAQLPDVYQSALRLHYWMGASMSEIAEMLDANENTVKSYLHRARQLLRAMLAERGVDA